MQRALKGDLDKLTERLASDRVQAALAAGDLAAAGTALGDGWKGVEEAAVLPPDLEQAYEGLPKTGFGRIAVLEAAMTEDKPVLWAIRADGKPAIALRSEEHTSELPSLMRISYAAFCVKIQHQLHRYTNRHTPLTTHTTPTPP